MLHKLLTDIRATYKSSDTEEWLDQCFNRPLGYLWALVFKRLKIHPNVVTIISILLGIGAGWMFFHADLFHNICGVILLMWANIYDSTDGQLARMTGQKTRWGRMLDGFAGDVWFFSIYLAICLRLNDQFIPSTSVRWGLWIWIACFICGTQLHSRQCRLADYYRNIHISLLKPSGGEFDTSEVQARRHREAAGDVWLWRLATYLYWKYTSAQEKDTPNFQKLRNYIQTHCGGQTSEAFRAEFRKGSLPLMKYTNILTFNCRAITLYVSCLIGHPWLYLLAEATVFTALAVYMRYRHERLCSIMLRRLQSGHFPTPLQR